MKSIKFLALVFIIVFFFLYIFNFTSQRSLFYFKYYNLQNQFIKYYNFQSPVETHMIFFNNFNTLLSDFNEILFSSHVTKIYDNKKSKKFEKDLLEFKKFYPFFFLNQNSLYYNQSLQVLQKSLDIFLTPKGKFIEGNSLFVNKNDGFILFEKNENILKEINFINSFILFKFLINQKIQKCDKFEEFSNFYILDNCIKEKNNNDFEYVVQMKLMKNTSKNINDVIIDQLPASSVQKIFFLLVFFFVGLYLIKKLYILNERKF